MTQLLGYMNMGLQLSNDRNYKFDSVLKCSNEFMPS